MTFVSPRLKVRCMYYDAIMKIKRIIVLIVLLLLVVGGAYFFWRQSGGATHGEILAAVREEGAATRQFIDRRANETDARLGRLDAKLDRLESKLDRLLKIAETPPPDGMIRVE